MNGEISRRRFLTTSASVVAAGMIDGVTADGTAYAEKYCHPGFHIHVR